MFKRMPLRALLTLPYLGLVLGLACIVGVLSYRSGRDAVDSLASQLLTETVNRINQAIEKHVSGSAAVLEAAFPRGTTAPQDLAAELPLLRTRFWLATSVHLDPNNYAYFGDREGRFFGLWRYSETEAELRLRLQGQGPRSIRHFSGIDGELGAPALETRIFEPRERPWYKAALANAHTWTAIYIDFKTAELVCTRARRVDDAVGAFAGVVATDLSLRQINAFLQTLKLSARGLAMVVEQDGNLIGVSRGPNLRTVDGQAARLNAGDSSDPLVQSTYQAVKRLIAQDAGDGARTGVFTDATGQPIEVGYARLRDTAGLDWLVMVAVPRDDFLHGVTRNFHNTVWLAVLSAIATAGVGLWVLSTVARELRRLADAARRVGEGSTATLQAVRRRDELGDLARSFMAMQSKLLTDELTGLANRQALIRRIEDRIGQHRRRGDGRPFALLFVDLNRFKSINDRFGHDVGDRVLQELAARLRAAVRAEDLVARFAGDEFVIVLDSVAHRREAEAVCEHLDTALRAPLASVPPPGAGGDGAALGIALFPDDGQDADTLLKHADAEMYRRKPLG